MCCAFCIFFFNVHKYLGSWILGRATLWLNSTYKIYKTEFLPFTAGQVQVCTSDLTARDHFCRHPARRRIEHNKGKNKPSFLVEDIYQESSCYWLVFTYLCLKNECYRTPVGKPLCVLFCCIGGSAWRWECKVWSHSQVEGQQWRPCFLLGGVFPMHGSVLSLLSCMWFLSAHS